MSAVGASADGISIMLPKGDAFVIKFPALRATQALILKEQMLSLGGEAAQSKDVITDSSIRSDVLLIGTMSHFKRLTDRLKRQQFSLPKIAEQLEALLVAWERRSSLVLRAREKTLDLSKRTALMGILNVTPDSFSDGGQFLDPGAAVERAHQMHEQGADIIDIGAESTRPGAEPVSRGEELNRLLPVVRAVSRELRAIISVDTYKSEVAEAVLGEGADMINDISGLRFDPNMARTLAKSGASLVVMHIQGTPRNMQQSPHYDDVLGEVYALLASSCAEAIEAGIDRSSVVVDPGIGFGKNLDHNLKLINHLETFCGLGVPLLVGTSRKSFIGMITGLPVDERSFGTAASVAVAVARGANIVRVHDVAQMRDVCSLADAIVGA